MKHHHIRKLCELSNASNDTPRTSLSAKARKEVLRKTKGTCHVCGGRAGMGWQADHLIPHRLGGKTEVSNLLPICRACNLLRRSHAPAVQQLILRLGTYARSEIRRKTPLGEELLSVILGRHKTNRRRRDSTGRPA